MMASGRFADYLGMGVIGDRPAAPVLLSYMVGLWYSTDTLEWSAWNGSVWLEDIMAGGGGTGVVETIVAGTGITVDSTDPANPIVAATGGGTGTVDSIVGGTGIDVDATDPANPVANLDSASIASLALADSAVQPAGLTAVSPIGLHSVPVMAGAIQPSVAGGCAALSSIVSAANQPDIVTLDFDPTTQEYAQFAIPMPKSWNEGTLTAEFRWSHAATTTNFGVVWNIQAVAVSNDDTIAANFGTAQQIADTGGTTNDLYVTSQTPAMTVGGSPAAGDTVFFRVSRVTGDGSDNMAVDARLHSVVLYMTTDAATDA